jgi:hypothetical protein
MFTGNTDITLLYVLGPVFLPMTSLMLLESPALVGVPPLPPVGVMVVGVKLTLYRQLSAERAHACLQCCGSMTFWGGSGSGSADPCL